MFQQGAMTKLRGLVFDFQARWDGGCNLGLGNLPSLEYLHVWVQSGGASQEEVGKVKVALKQMAEIHPNRPKFLMR